MAFKNAVKMLLSKFGLMWTLLLYLLITAVILVSLSIPFALPVVRMFRADGIIPMISAFFQNVTSGASTDVWFDDLYAIVQASKASFVSNPSVALNAGLWVGLVVVFAYRFIIGLYELPLLHVLEGSMSSNARIGFVGRYISCLGKSSRFVLVKMLYTIVYDTLLALVVYGLFELFNMPMLKFFAPFIIMVVLLVLIAMRYTFLAMWAPDVVIRDKGIFRAFGFSMKKGVRNMGSIFSTFLMAWTLIIAINMLVGFFTFGAGLILTVPISLLFVNLLNMTVYYGKTGKRYYVDATTVVTPPTMQE